MKFLVLIPALVHIYIFCVESFFWGKPRTNRTFGLRPSEVEPTRVLAFNQGVYNLLLGLAVIVGWFLWVNIFPGTTFAGQVLLVYSLGSIVVVGLTLLASVPRMWAAALLQLVPALVGLLVVFLPGV